MATANSNNNSSSLIRRSIGKRCRIHQPTADELRSTTFTNYIRTVVFRAARLDRDDDDDDDNEDQKQQQHNNYYTKKKIALDDGIAKIVFPKNYFQQSVPYGTDLTGRGGVWETDARLNFIIAAPIQQNIRGLAGIYEYTHRALPPMNLQAFRTMADQYASHQLPKHLYERTLQWNKKTVGTTTTTGGGKKEATHDDDDDDVEEDDTTVVDNVDEDDPTWQEDLANIERRFWKRLTPTMPPPIYGADHEGTLFGRTDEQEDADDDNDDPSLHFAISHLDSCLNLLADKIPGVTTPYLYAGMFATVFCAHTEDMDLLSMNYLHAGAPKLWYAVPEAYAPRFRSLAEHYYTDEQSTCREFLRHKRALLSPAILQKAGIPYTTAVQYPGEAILTFPGSYHFGFNMGYNVAEATNFAVPEWLQFGQTAKVCLCRPDSVRIHMGRVQELLQIYNIDTEYDPNLSYRDWRRKFQEEAKQLVLQQPEQEEKGGERPDHHGPAPIVVDPIFVVSNTSTVASSQPSSPVVALSSPSMLLATTSVSPANPQDSTAATPVEVPSSPDAATAVAPPSSSSSAAAAAKKKTKKRKPAPDTTATTTATTKTTTTSTRSRKKKQPLSDQQRKREFWVELTGKPNDWRLAQPIVKTNKAKSLTMARRILLFVSATDDYFSLGQSSRILHHLQVGEEACVAGMVVEVADGHVKLRLDGQTRANDFWLPIATALAKQKLFLDGGSYDDDNAAASMPALHYWDEKDSSQRRQAASITAAATSTTTDATNTTGPINNSNNATDPMI
jgi:hypothetical protein